MAKKSEKAVGSVVVSTVESAELAERISDLRAQLGPTEGHRVKIWRYNDVARENELLPSIALDQFSDEQVQQLYGGGKYSTRVVNAEGKFIAGGAWAFRIGGPPKFPKDGSADVAPAPAASGNPFAIGSLGDLKTLLEVVGGGGSKDPAAMAVSIATAMAAMQQQNMNLMLTLLGREKKSEGVGNIAETIDAVMSIADRFKSDSGGGSDGLMAAAFGTLAESLKAIAMNQRAVAPAAPARPALPAPAAPQEGETVGFNPVTLSPFVKNLIVLAQRGKDPELYAEVLLDQLEDVPAAAQYVGQQDTPEKRAALEENLYRLFPAAEPHREWIGKLFAEVWLMIDAPQDEETPAEA